MSITGDTIRTLFPNCADPEAWAAGFSEGFRRFKLDRRGQRAGVFAVVANETGGLVEWKREDGRYSAQRASEIWTALRRDPANRYSGPNALAIDLCSTVPQDKGYRLFSYVYANKYGNGPPESGDGWRNRGTGPIQLTFAHTIKACLKALGLDPNADPDVLIGNIRYAAMSACWFVSVYKPLIAKLWAQGDEAGFLAGAAQVGVGDGENTKRVRLAYYRKALALVLPAGVERDDAGNVKIANVENSTIVRDSNTGMTSAGVLGIASVGAPVVTAAAGAPWQTIVAIGGVAIVGAVVAFGVWLLFRKVKGARLNLFRDGVA